MALKLDVDVELVSPADTIWSAIKDHNNLFPKVFPDTYQSIEVLEGDGKSAGSVRLVTYAKGSLGITFVKSKIEAFDEEKKTVSFRIIEGGLLKYYKSFSDTIAVRAKDNGCIVNWSCEYEKASEEAPDADTIKDFTVKVLQDLDAYLLKDSKN